MKKMIFCLLIAGSFFAACEVVEKLSQGEVSAAFKEVLDIGVDSAVDVLGVENGYYGDEEVKIPLPPEAQKVLENATMPCPLQNLN